MITEDWTTENDDGIWCNVCGEQLLTKDEAEAGDEASQCKQCGAPDEIDPDKI